MTDYGITWEPTWAHGASGYQNHDCRCAVCRDGHAVAVKKARKARAARLAADPSLAVHGKPTTYSNWQCRCDACRDAWAAQGRELYARRKGTGN